MAGPLDIPSSLQRYIAMAINQAIGRPQEVPPGPPIDSLILDDQAMEEDRLAWQQIVGQKLTCVEQPNFDEMDEGGDWVDIDATKLEMDEARQEHRVVPHPQVPTAWVSSSTRIEQGQIIAIRWWSNSKTTPDISNGELQIDCHCCPSK